MDYGTMPWPTETLETSTARPKQLMDLDARIGKYLNELEPVGKQTWSTIRPCRRSSWKGSFPSKLEIFLLYPEGFHYDVTASSGKPFAMNDHADRAHPVVASGHLNIDPRGYVRG